MVIVRQFGPKPVMWGVVAWAVAVATCLFVAWTAGHAGISSDAGSNAYAIAACLTAVVGFWLGWRHRVGTAFLAPFLAWVVAVPFAFCSSIMRAGFFVGLFKGLGLAIVGGFFAAVIEGMLLVTFAILGRIASGALGHRRDAGIVIIPPRTG